MATTTSQRKPMTRAETLAFQKTLEGFSSLNAHQLAAACRLCNEFGPAFAGIRDRCNWVAADRSNREAVQEFLHSVNPVLAAEILAAPSGEVTARVTRYYATPTGRYGRCKHLKAESPGAAWLRIAWTEREAQAVCDELNAGLQAQLREEMLRRG
jgi:hypothetical protein